MIGYHDAAINGTWISEIDDRIVVVDVLGEEPQNRVLTMQRAHNHGLRYIRTMRESLSATIRFAIWEQDVAIRNDILRRVQQWAAAAMNDVAVLEINDRRGQQLYVRASEIPVGGAAKWSETLDVVFTAFELPYWMDAEFTTIRVSSKGRFFVPGFGEAFCEAELTNAGSETITTATLSVGDAFITFEAINLEPAGKLVISYDRMGRMSARIGETSILANRTPQSADDLIVLCGAQNTVEVQANGSVSAVFKARGVYM